MVAYYRVVCASAIVVDDRQATASRCGLLPAHTEPASGCSVVVKLRAHVLGS